MATAFADHAGTWDKVLTGAPLAPGEELRRGFVLYNINMLDSANRFQQFESGYLDAQLWQARLEILGPLVKLPIFEMWRDTPGGRNQPPDFLKLLDRLSSDAATGPYWTTCHTPRSDSQARP